MMIRSMPPASAHLADRPMPAPPPMIGRPAATWARSRRKHSSRVKKLIPFPPAWPQARSDGYNGLRSGPRGVLRLYLEVPGMALNLIGTLDTKGAEIAFLRERIRAAGRSVYVIDVGVLGTPAFTPDIPREEVFEAAARGVAKLVSYWFNYDNVHGVLAIGGSAGTTIGTAAMRALPFGIPKLMVSTLASGQVQPYVGVRDIMMLHSVVDISGLNRISRTVLANAAHAMVGMVKGQGTGDKGQGIDKPLVTATMFGVTT